MLNQEINHRYVDQFQLTLGDAWQGCLNDLDAWEIDGLERQDAFFETWVAPLARQKARGRDHL